MSNLQTAYQYFLSQGDSQAASAGIAAGLQAESSLNPSAYNNSSGATGIAQWLGGRLQALEGLFGSSPSFEQQLEFVQEELTGTAGTGNQGGATILADTSPAQALQDFINLFERPAPGPQTTGDIQRGTTALSTLNMAGTPSAGSANLGVNTTGLSVTGDTGALGNFELGTNVLFNNPGLFVSTLFGGSVTPQSIASQGIQATGQMGAKGAGEASNAIAAQVAAGVGAAVAPLTSWLTGLTAASTVTRVTVGIVAIVLLMAGIFFLAGNKSPIINMTGQRALNP